MQKRKPSELLAMVDHWNKTVPVGTPVEVTKDRGEIIETKTASEAWMLGGHTPVILVEGISGGYSLERVRVKGVPRGK